MGMVTHGNSLFKHIFQTIVRSWNVGLHGHPGNAWLGHTLFQFLKPHKRLILSCMECLAWQLDVLVLSDSQRFLRECMACSNICFQHNIYIHYIYSQYIYTLYFDGGCQPYWIWGQEGPILKQESFLFVML